MIFARYKGPDVAGGGVFISGKIYFGKPEMDDEDVVSMEFIIIKDEDAKPVRVYPNEGRFEFLDEVYAVALHPMDEYEVGDVMVLDGGEINGDTYVHIKGFALRKASDVEVLDKTNVNPSIVVQDVNTGIWMPIGRVDECLWVVVQGQDTFRAPTEFKFAVSQDGELMSMPMVKCVDADNEEGLTSGKFYTLIRTDFDSDFNYIIINDKGVEGSYLPWRFKMG
jgi:hypothetical protein